MLDSQVFSSGAVFMMYGWKELYEKCMQCSECGLCRTRNSIVFGEGNTKADIMFVGEGPGADEDRLGRPFVGRAGQLLEKGINALGWTRDDVYICNVVKCRPPNNRVPETGESSACIHWLRNQTALIRPRIIVCLGSTAAKAIISGDFRITCGRGKWVDKNGFLIMPTFHPAALFRDETKKVPFWHDLKEVKRKYEEIRAEK